MGQSECDFYSDTSTNRHMISVHWWNRPYVQFHFEIFSAKLNTPIPHIRSSYRSHTDQGTAREWEGSGGNLNGALLERHWTLTELIRTVGMVGTAEVGLHVQNFGCCPPILNDW